MRNILIKTEEQIFEELQKDTQPSIEGDEMIAAIMTQANRVAAQGFAEIWKLMGEIQNESRIKE